MYINKIEVYCSMFIWITGVSISLYRLFLVGRVFDHKHHDLYHYEDFRKGWNILGGRFQDQADSEWNIWTLLVLRLSPFLTVNLFGAEYLRYKKFSHLLPPFYTLVTTFFLLFYFNAILLFWFITQTLIYLIVIYTKSYILLWIISFVIIYFLNPDVWFAETEEDQYLILVSSSWMVLRSISYSCEQIMKKNAPKLKISDSLTLLGYSFYLPTMFCGPFISFNHFEKGLEINYFQWNYKRIQQVAISFIKIIFWFFFTLFALHFVYVNAILLRPTFVQHLLDWELAGLGIAMGHFFHLKYIVFYGIPCAWAAAEGFTTPKLPCCVSTVHLYSYMWRNFDHGLYQFLIRYIYVPVISKVKGNSIISKTLASIICFIFIFVWHGGHDYVFFWVFFNYIAVTVELIVKHIYNLAFINNFLNRHISPQNLIRIQCFFAAPLHCFSMISNYFFIGNRVEIGFTYINRVLYGSLSSKLTIWFFLYGAGQSAVAIQKWRQTKETKKRS